MVMLNRGQHAKIYYLKHQFALIGLNRINCFENQDIDIYQPLPSLKEAIYLTSGGCSKKSKITSQIFSLKKVPTVFRSVQELSELTIEVNISRLYW